MNLRLIWGATALAVGVALAGCSGVGDLAGDIAKQMVPAIAIGECTNLEAASSEKSSEVNAIEKVPCDQAHSWEAYAEKQYGADDTFPGEEAVITASKDYCDAQFEGFVGRKYDESAIEVQYLYPTESSWKLKDRTITCLVGSSNKDVVGSLKGSGK